MTRYLVNFIFGAIFTASGFVKADCYDSEFDDIRTIGTVVKEIEFVYEGERKQGFVVDLEKPVCINEIGSVDQIIVDTRYKLKPSDQHYLKSGRKYKVFGETYELPNNIDGAKIVLDLTSWEAVGDW